MICKRKSLCGIPMYTSVKRDVTRAFRAHNFMYILLSDVRCGDLEDFGTRVRLRCVRPYCFPSLAPSLRTKTRERPSYILQQGVLLAPTMQRAGFHEGARRREDETTTRSQPTRWQAQKGRWSMVYAEVDSVLVK